MTGLSRDSHLNRDVREEKQNVVYAGFWQRVFAVCVDAVLFCVLVYLPLFILASLFPSAYENFTSNLDSKSPKLTILSLQLFVYFIASIIFACFYSSKWQASPGKRLLNVYVTSYNLKPISFKRGFFRYFIQSVFTIFPQILFLISGVDLFILEEDPSFIYNENTYMVSIIAGVVYPLLAILWYLMAVFSAQKTAFHDVICGTRALKGRPSQKS